MQSTNQPTRYLIPFAQNDSARVEIPATTTDATRMSQSLGSPPLTGMPPEAGGVPPQLEDFNGAMNQVARVPWWLMLGGRFGYSGTFAADPLIDGYPRGAVLPAAIGAGLIGMGEWYNNAENNQIDPDVTGTGWVPGYHYGATALTGQTGGTVTLTPAQAAKRVITVAGTLTSNLVLVVPGWIYDWTVHNSTGGAFTVTVKNAATSGVVIPQNGAPTPVRCDGTTCTLWSPNIGPAVSDSQPMQLAQGTGRLVRNNLYAGTSGGQVLVVDGGAPTSTGAATFTPQPGTRAVRVICQGAGGAGGGTTAMTASTFGAGGGGASGAYSESWYQVSALSPPVTITCGTGGSGVTGATGQSGGPSSFGSLASAAGGAGGSPSSGATAAGGAGSTGVGNIYQGQGAPGMPAVCFGNTLFVSGAGGNSKFGGGGNPRASTTAGGQSSAAYGGGGGGAGGQNNAAATAGGAGGYGLVIVEEYS